MVHIVMVVVFPFLQLLLQLQLHHANAGAGMGACTANDLVDVLISFPVRFQLTVAERTFNSLQVVEGKGNALLDLLAVQVDHFIDDIVTVQMVEDFFFSLFFFLLVLALKSLQVINSVHD